MNFVRHKVYQRTARGIRRLPSRNTTNEGWLKLSNSEARHAHSSAMHLVPDVECDEQRGDRFDDARVFKFAAVHSAYPGNFQREIGCYLPGAVVIAANNHIAIHVAISGQHAC